MIVARTRAELTEAKRSFGGPRRLVLVPTMGYLHEGHLSLVDVAGADGGPVAVSIFVNPLQFGPAEDFSRYPRDEAHDLERLAARKVDLVFAPQASEVYPDGVPVVTVRPGSLGERLCGAFRPGHFEGVLTVVAKLFGLIEPRAAVFGGKDHQQAVLIRRMVADLELGVEVRVGPTVRETDGLVMSSRNAYLSPDERAQALGIPAALEAAGAAFEAGERAHAALVAKMTRTLQRYPTVQLQYAEVVDPDTLEPVRTVQRPALAAIAAFVGRTRLIDNRKLA